MLCRIAMTLILNSLKQVFGKKQGIQKVTLVEQAVYRQLHLLNLYGKMNTLIRKRLTNIWINT